MIYNILICDDNKIELKINQMYVETFAEIYKVQVNTSLFSDTQEALDYVANNRIDIAFLDINMGKDNYTGIKLAGKILKKYPNVVNIFITGEMVSVPEVFNVRAFDYIQKPIESEKFKISFVRAVNQVIGVNNRQRTTSLLITVDNLKKKIRQSNILYVEKELAKSKIVLKNKEIFYVYETIKSLSERLESDFVQISQSVIVNINEVRDINRGIVVMINEVDFPIGRSYNKSLKQAYNDRLIR